MAGTGSGCEAALVHQSQRPPLAEFKEHALVDSDLNTDYARLRQLQKQLFLNLKKVGECHMEPSVVVTCCLTHSEH